MYGQKFLRGQVWWVGGKQNKIEGCIQTTNRPHLIIGNNVGNRCSPVLLVVPCTTEEKKPMPTHVEFEMNGKKNTILCEQIKTIDTDEMLSYMFTLDEETMEKVNKALKVSIGLEEENDEEYTHVLDAMRYSLQNFVPELENESIITEMNTNKRGRIWDLRAKTEFVRYFEKYGEKETAQKYNTKGNTKLYYKRFVDTLKGENSNEKSNENM